MVVGQRGGVVAVAQARASLRNVLLCVSRDLHDVKMIRFSAVFEGGQSLPRAREAGEGSLPRPAVPSHEARAMGPRLSPTVTRELTRPVSDASERISPKTGRMSIL